MNTYNRVFLGLEFWAYMQAPASVFAALPTRREPVPSSECLMCCGTEG